MKNWIFGLVAAFILSGCSALQMSSDYDAGFAFDSLHDFTLVEQTQKPEHSLTYTHISRAVTKNLTDKGYTETTKENADFYILLHIDIKNITEVQTDYDYAGLTPYPYNYYRSDMPAPYPYYIDPYDLHRSVTTTTSTYEYQEGKLIVDVFDPKSNKVIWRGIVKDEIRSFKTAQEKIAYINKTIKQLLASFPGRGTTEK